MGRFAEALKSYMERQDISQAELARRLGHQSNGLVSQAVRGKPLPLDDLDRWLDALRVEGQEREYLWNQAYEDYAPPNVLKLVHRLQFLEEELHKEREANDVLRKLAHEVRQLSHEVTRSSGEPPPGDSETPG